MKKINEKEKGAALINVMLVVLLAVAIGLPLLYLVIVNFTFRMFDNNLRGISYKNEMGMDNIYAIIQGIVIDETNIAKNDATNIVDTQVKAEQDAYKAWTSDGKYLIDKGEDGVLGTEDDKVSDNEDIEKLKKYMAEYSVLKADEGVFTYLDSEDGSVKGEAVKEAYNNYFKTYYKNYMDTRAGTFEDKLKNKAESNYSMKKMDDFDENADREQYGVGTSDYITYSAGGADSTSTKIRVQVKYRGKSEATDRYVNSDVFATFTIGVPEFDSASSINQTTVKISNPLLDKTLVIGNAIELAKDKSLSVTGNSLINGEAVTIGTASVNLGESSNLDIKGKLAVNGDISLAGGTNNSTNIIKNTFTTEGDVFCNEIKIIGEYTDTNINGTLYIADDMEFNKKNTNMVVGTWMGFNDDPSDSSKSSAILFNDKEGELTNVKLDITSEAYVAGTAFLGDMGYKTGESVSMRGNYRAYQGMIKDEMFTDTTSVDYKYRSSNVIFNNFGGVTLFTDYIGRDGNEAPDITPHKTNYFMLSYGYGKNNISAFLTSMPALLKPNDKPKMLTKSSENKSVWKYSTGAYYDSVDNEWENPIGLTDDATLINAAKDYEKYTKYFGYGEGNEHREIEDENGEKHLPTVVGKYGWIDIDKLKDASEAKDENNKLKYNTFDGEDEVIVLISKGDITLNSDLMLSKDGVDKPRKGIIIAGGNITVEDEITFEGTLICGGKLIVNDNFTLINNSIAVTKIIDSAVSTDDKEVFNLFRDDGSGNLYTYSTIDTQIASINMNDLIKISDWNKSKFDI